MRAVRYDSYGGPEVLRLVELPAPEPAPGEVLVELRAAGLNPADYKVRRGGIPVRPLPSGIGREFSGVVVGLSPEAGETTVSTGFAVGDEVIGTAEWVMADRVAVPASQLARKPPGLDWAAAASIPVAAQTAWMATLSQSPTTADTALVSNAAGGVGFLVTQLLVRAGVRVIGTAGARNHARLLEVGAIPTLYGAGLVDRVRDLAPEGITVAFDHHGPDAIEAALELGVPRARINTISGWAERYAVASVGRRGMDRAVVETIAAELLAGTLAMPMDSAFPLERVVEAYTHLESGASVGKVTISFG